MISKIYSDEEIEEEIVRARACLFWGNHHGIINIIRQLQNELKIQKFDYKKNAIITQPIICQTHGTEL